jgi:hypothetical protein
MGVRHHSRNFGNGGLGTLHNGIAASNIYGPDVDALLWDSGMTELEASAPDAMARQAMLGGMKVPALWTLHPETATYLHLAGGADTGLVGTGYFGVDKGMTLQEIKQMPWAMQYVNCDNELHDICRSNEYQGQCWVDRDDFTPTTRQNDEPGGRARWHPGNRIHQVQGRVLAFTFLQALKDALTLWHEAEGYELADDTWHVTERYESIRSKLSSQGQSFGNCHKYDTLGIGFICDKPMKVRISLGIFQTPELVRILSAHFRTIRDERNSPLARIRVTPICVP